MHTFGTPQVQRKRFYRKSELQMFLLISSGLFSGPKLSTNMASPYVKHFGEYMYIVTQKLWATKAWDLDKLFIYWSLITFHLLGFFHCTVSNLFFCAVFIAWQWKRRIEVKQVVTVKYYSFFLGLTTDFCEIGAHSNYWRFQMYLTLENRHELCEHCKTSLFRKELNLKAHSRSVICTTSSDVVPWWKTQKLYFTFIADRWKINEFFPSIINEEARK